MPHTTPDWPAVAGKLVPVKTGNGTLFVIPAGSPPLLLSPAASSCPRVFLSQDRSGGRGTQESAGAGTLNYGSSGPLRRVNRFYTETTESSEDSNPCHNPVTIP